MGMPEGWIGQGMERQVVDCQMLGVGAINMDVVVIVMRVVVVMMMVVDADVG